MFLEYSSQSHLNGLNYGTSKENVRKFFNSSINEIYKTPISKNKIDHFYELNIQAFYDDADKFIGIEIYQPNRLIYNKQITLLDQSYYSLMTELKQHKIQFEQDFSGLSFEKGRIEVYVYDSLLKNAECVSVYIDLLNSGALSHFISNSNDNK